MYLTRIPVDICRRKGLEFAGSPYRIHAAVESSFATGAPRTCDGGRILWRLDDPIGRADCLWLYILSPSEPDCEVIVDQSGLPVGSEPETKAYGDVLASISEGQCWQFRLKANPVRKVLVDKGRVPREGVRGTVQGHVTEAQQRAWLLDRAAAHGFEVMGSTSGAEALAVSHRRRERFKRDGGTVTLVTAQYDGVLKVTDVRSFRKTLGFGMGRAKGFGCGLMTIAPVAGGGR